VQCITQSFGNFEDKAFNILKIRVETKQNVIWYKMIIILFSFGLTRNTSFAWHWSLNPLVQLINVIMSRLRTRHQIFTRTQVSHLYGRAAAGKNQHTSPIKRNTTIIKISSDSIFWKLKMIPNLPQIYFPHFECENNQNMHWKYTNTFYKCIWFQFI